MRRSNYIRQKADCSIVQINIDDLKQHILSGRRLDPLAIYADGKEDGRHRAHAALELGIKRVPVLDFRR
jgi:ParB-like chromosome segregation protein Spo0J